jgi:ornithine cyclodeaminase
MAECIDVMAGALAAVSRGEVYNPLRVMARPPGEESLMGLMPSHRGGDSPLYALKALAIFPSNAARGLDLHQGFVALFDGETGEARAFLNAGAITRIRTAAVSGVATRCLARDDVRTLAILGTGVQARAHVEAMRAVREFERIVAWGRTVTSSPEPVVSRDWLKPGVHINAVGAAFPTTRELDSRTVADASFFVDRRESTVNESGDYLLPLQEGVIGPDHIRGESGELVLGTAAGRRSPDEITIFKSLGIAVEDLAAAEYVVARAEREQVGAVVSL